MIVFYSFIKSILRVVTANKKIMFKKTFVFAAVSAFLLIGASGVSADYVGPQPSPVGALFLNKTVKHPDIQVFVENLDITAPHFLPEQEVFFRIEVKNVGNKDLVDTMVKDILPDQLIFADDPNKRIMEFKIDRLSPDQSKFFEIKVRVKSQKDLPNNNITCVTNVAEARVENLVNQDTSVICIESKVLGIVKTLPKTGINNFDFLLAGSVLASLLAIFLMRKSQNNSS